MGLLIKNTSIQVENNLIWHNFAILASLTVKTPIVLLSSFQSQNHNVTERGILVVFQGLAINRDMRILTVVLVAIRDLCPPLLVIFSML